MCKKKKISGYSKLKKEDLIKILSKKKGGKFDKDINTGLLNEYKNRVVNSDEYFIAFESDNPDLFNKNNNKYYESMNIYTGGIIRVFKDNFTVMCQIPDSGIVKVKVKKIYHINESKKLLVVEGSIVSNNI